MRFNSHPRRYRWHGKATTAHDASPVTTPAPARTDEQAELRKLTIRLPAPLIKALKTRALGGDRTSQDIVAEAVTAYLAQP